MRALLRPALVITLILTVVTGVGYPLTVVLLGRALLPAPAGGSLVHRDGRLVGSLLVAQRFTAPHYFHPRPSAAGAGYDATASGGTNLGPLHPRLLSGRADDPGTPADEGFDGVVQLADAYRRANGLTMETRVPPDAVYRSGSGLDPHITPANAWAQVPRVARARGLHEEAVRLLVDTRTEGRQWGLLGERRVNVLGLNLALDAMSAARRP